MTMAKTPDSIIKDEPNYQPAAWQDYTLAELGSWVHLFVKRAGMRDNPAKKAKDLADAQAYLDMMQAQLDAAKDG
jgi:hypothetical protein